ncbi:uncharacterized protein [Lepidochelys kempii]|uniref:uncharacterized protein n=1 Tax=Lepidochelys kempii TaxID=8472 RepID=UPI003C6F873D
MTRDAPVYCVGIYPGKPRCSSWADCNSRRSSHCWKVTHSESVAPLKLEGVKLVKNREAKMTEPKAEKVKEAAHRREMEAKENEMEAAHRRAMEVKEKERKHALEMEKARAQQNISTNPSNPSPGTASHSRKFSTYKAGDDTEAFLENFERACLGYSISTDQYMVALRPQLSGPLAEVAAQMPREHMNKYELFKTKTRVRMGLTPEHSHRWFRALRWKPDMSFTRHAYHIVKHWDAWISGTSVKSP